MRKPFVAGNWKMNTDINSAVELAKAIAERSVDALSDNKMTVAVCPPSVYLSSVAGGVEQFFCGPGCPKCVLRRKGCFYW